MGVYGIVSLLSQPIAGVYADRLNKKKLMILTDIIQAIICFTLFLLIVNDSLHLFHLYCASILFAVVSPFFERTGFSLIPQIVGKDSLLRANSIFQGIQTMAKIVPPALAGVIIKVLGLEILFLLNGISFLFSALCILFIQIKNSLKRLLLTLNL
jgi:MFS family permease